MSEPTELELAVIEQAAWAALDDADLLAMIASYAFCYATFKSCPDELRAAFDVAWNRGLLNEDL